MGLQGSRAAAIQTIVFQILLCLLTFYTLYYMIGSVCCGVFRLNSFDVRLPFEFKMEPSYSNPKYLVNVISMELTFFSSGVFFAVMLRRWVWDYALTVTSTHLLLTWAGEPTEALKWPKGASVCLEQWPKYLQQEGKQQFSLDFMWQADMFPRHPSLLEVPLAVASHKYLQQEGKLKLSVVLIQLADRFPRFPSLLEEPLVFPS
uniref:uncharacterized protein LOC130474727 n=1 Tax=Euleptes europaea TaxID=460621 RepID=UPI002541A8A2|nr:uncharacterized protein LOC130474727 [Euleptes europaea]